MPGELRAPLIVLESLPEGIVSIRAPLLVTEPLTESSDTQIRDALVVIEPLTEHFRQLLCSLVCVESLHPVPPEGHVSTELFPGSLGSPNALPGLAFSIGKRPGFSTAKYKGASGVGVRRANMEFPIWEIELSFEFLRDRDSINNNEYRTLCGFFMSRHGDFDTFLLKDRDDYRVAGGAIATADGVTTQFGFMRVFGGFPELVGQVDLGQPVNVYVNGVLQTLGVDYTIDLPNQMVFTSAPADTMPITADFEFFFNCVFQDSMADFEKFADKFWELQKIVLETVPQ